MGLMSVVNSLASSPLGKIAGGYLEGEIDKQEAEAEAKKTKDARYAAITDGLVNNLLTIEANVIANATKESQIYDEGKNWAISKFGEGGLAVIERMRQDGLISGANSWNDVLVNSNNVYGAGLPEGSEPWYMQQEWADYAEQFKDYKAPNDYYKGIINQSQNQIGNILKNNGIGDYTFELFSGAKTTGTAPTDSRPMTMSDVGAATMGASTTVQGEPGTQATNEGTVDITSLGSAPVYTNKGIAGYNANTYSKAVASSIEQNYPQFDQLFIMGMDGSMTFNKTAFAGDTNRVQEVNNAMRYIDNTLLESRDLYQTGKLNNDATYGQYSQFFNTKDFDEQGFVRMASDAYFDVINQQKAELIKINVLKSDLREQINDGTLNPVYLAELSDYLDDVFPYKPGDPNSWENMYLNAVALEDSPFKRAYDEAVTDYFREKRRIGGYNHTMQFISPADTVQTKFKGSQILSSIPEEDRTKPYVEYYKKQITNFVDGDFGPEPINSYLNRIAPENFADVKVLQQQFGFQQEQLIQPMNETFDFPDTYKDVNSEAVATVKKQRTNVVIPGLPTVASSILAQSNMTTGAQVLSWMQSLNGDVNAIRQAVIGMIVNDIQAGNIDNMPSAQIIDLADQVLLDLGQFAGDEFDNRGSTDADAIVADNENLATIENDNTDINEAIDNETADSSDKLEEELQNNFETLPNTGGVGRWPWLFENGQFNPEFAQINQKQINEWEALGKWDREQYIKARVEFRKQEAEERRDNQKERLSNIFQTIKDFALPDKDNK